MHIVRVMVCIYLALSLKFYILSHVKCGSLVARESAFKPLIEYKCWSLHDTSECIAAPVQKTICHQYP